MLRLKLTEKDYGLAGYEKNAMKGKGAKREGREKAGNVRTS